MEYIVFDGERTIDYGLRVLGYNRPSAPDNRDVYTDYSGREGSLHYSQLDGMYNFSVSFRVHFADEEERVRRLEEISSLFYTDDFVEIEQSDLVGRYRLGKVIDFVDFEPRYNYMDIDVEFITRPYAIDRDGNRHEETFIESEESHIVMVDELGTAFNEFVVEIQVKKDIEKLYIGVGDEILEIDSEIKENELVIVDTETFRVDNKTKDESLILDTYGSFPNLHCKGRDKISIWADKEFGCDVVLEYVKRYLM